MQQAVLPRGMCSAFCGQVLGSAVLTGREREGGQHGDIDFGTKYGSHQDPTHQCTMHCTRFFVMVKVHLWTCRCRSDPLHCNCASRHQKYQQSDFYITVVLVLMQFSFNFPQKLVWQYIAQHIEYCNIAQDFKYLKKNISTKACLTIFHWLPLLCSSSPHYYAFPSLSLSPKLQMYCFCYSANNC